EPLRGAATPAETEEEDYRLRLVQADGAPPPPVFCVIAGNPTLYLTANAVFTGPPPQEHVLDPLTENPIPAPAIERAAGVAFLQSLGLELPPRVRDRVRSLPLEVAIQCELRPVHLGSSTEECCITVVAEAPDGHQETWHNFGWTDSTPERTGKKNDRLETAIIVYDR